MIEMTSNKLSTELLSTKQIRNDQGCMVTFIGTVRNTSKDGSPVTALDIKPKADAEAKLNQIAAELCAKWQLSPDDITICRRYGILNVGEIGLVVAIAAPHRAEAFKACEYVIDRIKQGDITTEKDIISKS